MDLQAVLIWIVIGAIAGVLAESMVGGPRRGGLGTAILIGILGAFIGGWLFSALGISIGGGIIGTIITAFSGDSQSTPIFTIAPNPLVVRVTDTYDNPVAGASVDWTISGGGSGSIGTTTTRAAGTAFATGARKTAGF